MKKNNLYEKYHEFTHTQKKIIAENNFTYRNIIFFLKKYLFSNKKFKNVLDIGCGAGTIPLYIASRGYGVHGIDISDKAVDSASDSAKHLKLNNAKFERIDFPERYPDGTYDFIVFTETIEHLKDDRKALNVIFKILRKDGLLLISTPLTSAPLARFGFVKEFDERVGHLRRYTEEELIRKSKDAGFSVVEMKKTEGILRNYLFINDNAGKLVRYLKYFIWDIVALVDSLLIPIFGASNVFLILKK